jgi:nitrate/TMAO reductase-like tetraheme cytochrome c subunit
MNDNSPPSSNNDNAETGKPSLWQRMKRPPQCSMLRMSILGIVGGIFIWGGLNTGMEWTNRSEFCTSCHEMTIPYEELKKTVHYKNSSGTTVQCADCHVASSKTPTDYMFKSFQKLMAARDVISHIKELWTREKFEILTMAKRVGRMKPGFKDANCHISDHGSGKAEGSLGGEARRCDGGRQDLHRMPQGHRAQGGSPSAGAGKNTGRRQAGLSRGVRKRFPY